MHDPRTRENNWQHTAMIDRLLQQHLNPCSVHHCLPLEPTTQPLLSALIPTEPIPPLRSSHHPAGKLAEHPPNACRILKTAPGTTSNISHTFMSAGDTNFLPPALPAITW